MAAKVQPSLTITQLGKLPPGAIAQQSVSSAMQGMGSGSSGGGSPSTSTSSGSSNNLSPQLVNVSQSAAGQLLTAQNIVSSAGGATVLPLAIGTRGGTGGNILTGTITPIKNASGIAVGKLMTPAQVAAAAENAGGSASIGGAPTSMYIHHASSPQRPHSGSGNTISVASTAASSSASSVLSSGSTGSSAFLPPGSTIYYESMPANSVQVSTGVLSLTTTTATSSTMSQHHNTSSASMAISSLPFASHAANPAATFTVVPSSGVRTIGQLQIPVSSGGGTQIQAMPVRFSALAPGSVAGSAADAIAVSQSLQSVTCSSGQQILIPGPHQGTATATLTGQQGQHMVIPLQTSIKVTSGGSTGVSGVPSFLRKRDADGSPIRAAKNLGPTLLSMGSGVISGGMSGISNVGVPYSMASVASTSAAALTAEALAENERVALVSALGRVDSPGSTDGSTTVSANSSPGVEQQMQDGNLLPSHMVSTMDAMHFNPINELYANHPAMTMQHNLPGTSFGSRNSSLDFLQLNASTSSQRLNGGAMDAVPRKKSRRSTDSQHSLQNQATRCFMAPGIGPISNILGSSTDSAVSTGNGSLVTGNKENTKPKEYILRRPRNCTLLQSYKQTWKTASNHFQRYTDVKPREERRPTIMDLANQANVLAKINGWKIYHLRATMEDLCENETSGYEKLKEMLEQMENDDSGPELERIKDLVKGNIQRSKIIVDGITDAQNQIMKIFDHKAHVSDIIQRCASKRNFKKREKLNN